jgi:cytochrome c peroxidase
MKKINFLLTMAGVFLLTAAFEISHYSEKLTTIDEVGTPYLPDQLFNYDIPFPEWYKENIFWVNQNANHVNERITREKATLGRVLFYDKRLSLTDEVSCGSCHKQEFGFADNLQFSEGVNGQQTKRNTPNINDLGWRMSYQPIDQPFFWDARATHLDQMVLMPIVHEGEMGKDLEVLVEKLTNTEFYPALFEAAFGDQEINPERIGKAISLFIQSLNVFDTKFDKVLMGEAVFTEQELRGQELFMENCNSCHAAPQFAIPTPLSNTFPSVDPGYGAITGDTLDNGKFKTTTLRNITLTAPYMHDGSINTLEEVMAFYSDSIPQTFIYYGPAPDPLVVELGEIDFDEQEIEDLIAFLETLTSETLAMHEKFSDPFQEPSMVRSLPLDKSFAIFPNPYSEKTTIQFDNSAQATYRFRLLNNQGQLLRSFASKDSEVELEKDSLPAGVYFLEIRKGQRVKVEKLVVQ